MFTRTACGVALLVGVLMGVSAAQETLHAPGPGGRLFPAPDIDALLQRPYLSAVPMAGVGECVWAAHPDGWAFGNGVHYYLLTPGGMGFDLRIEAVNQAAEVAQATAYPSHVRLYGGTENVSVEGAKWIAGDDVMSTVIRLENLAKAESVVTLALSVPSDAAAQTGDRIVWRLEQPPAKLDVMQHLHAPGFVPAAAAPAAGQVYFVQGEDAAAQQGSEARDRKPAASGRAVLGSNFGADAGDFAEWVFDVAEAQDDMVVAFRYARAMPGDAEFRVSIDGRVIDRQGFQPTGGWGDAASDFKTATLPAGPLSAGQHRIKLLAVGSGANVNIDVVSLQPAGWLGPVPGLAQSVYVRRIVLAPGAAERVALFCAAGTREAKIEAALARTIALADPLADQRARYNAWLAENVPAFTSPREEFVRQYWHRATSVLRKNLFRPGEGRMPGWSFAEGRWNSGWYPNTISYGAGHQIREARWLRDPQYVRDFIDTWCNNLRPNGIFPNFIRPDDIGDGQYTDWIASTVWDAHCVQPDLDKLAAWAPALAKNLDGWLDVYDKDGDGLLLVDSHWWTGMEWQPSFFAFTGFDAKQQDGQLERLDLTAYVYGNARNLAHIARAAGDAAVAHRADALADKMREAVAAHMWDPETNFLYSVEPATHRKAMVKEIVACYPFYFGMFGDGAPQAAVWRAILDPAEFWTPWPVASASKQCPAYSQDDRFNGKSATVCMWNGPTWPHANSIVLSAMADTLRRFEQPPLLVNHFWTLLASYTVAQFKDQQLGEPFTGEFYNGETAQWRTGERDYNHSTYIDLLIADLAGLRPRADDILELHPLLGPDIPSYCIDGIRYHGHDLTLAYTRAEDTAGSPDGLAGYRAYANGRLVYHMPQPDLARAAANRALLDAAKGFAALATP